MKVYFHTSSIRSHLRVAFYFKEKVMNNKTLPKKLTRLVEKKTARRKATPQFFNAEQKSKETSKLKSSEIASVENLYVNGSIHFPNVNRGK
jgi:hypothetical protein